MLSCVEGRTVLPGSRPSSSLSPSSLSWNVANWSAIVDDPEPIGGWRGGPCFDAGIVLCVMIRCCPRWRLSLDTPGLATCSRSLRLQTRSIVNGEDDVSPKDRLHDYGLAYSQSVSCCFPNLSRLLVRLFPQKEYWVSSLSLHNQHLPPPGHTNPAGGSHKISRV